MNEKDIFAAYQQAAQAEVRLAKLEGQRRALDAKIFSARKISLAARDKLHAIHLGINEPVLPFRDTPDLVVPVDRHRRAALSVALPTAQAAL